jgi:hypothetical protein
MGLDAMMAENETNHMTISSLNARISDMQIELDTSTESTDSLDDGLVIAVIVIVSALLVVSSVTLFVLVSREKRGAPVFAPVTGTPVARNVAVGSPVGGATTYGSPVGGPTKGASEVPPAGGNEDTSV